MSVLRWIDKQNMVYSHNGKWFAIKVTSNSMGEFKKQ